MRSHGDRLSSQQGSPPEEVFGPRNPAPDSWAGAGAGGGGGSNRGGSVQEADAAEPSRREADLRIRMAAGEGPGASGARDLEG